MSWLFASRWPRYWSFSFSISPSSEYSGLISFRIDWFDLLTRDHSSSCYLCISIALNGAWHTMCVCVHAQSLQPCPTLCYPMDGSPPGSSVHGLLQAGILSGLLCPPPGDLPNPGIESVPLAWRLHWQGGFHHRRHLGRPTHSRSSTNICC